MPPKEAVGKEALDTQEAAAVQREWRDWHTSAQSCWNNLTGEQDSQGTAGLGSSFVEREMGLLRSQGLSRGHCCVTAEVGCTLSSVSKEVGSTPRESESPLSGPSEIVLEMLGPVWGFLGQNQH